jgi:hypothetical protein
MSYVRALLAKLFVMVGLAFPRLPRVIVLLDVLQQPRIARVLLTRRRSLAYEEFFTLRDRDGRRGAPIARAAPPIAEQNDTRSIDDTSADRYIRVRAA